MAAFSLTTILMAAVLAAPPRKNLPRNDRPALPF